MNVYVLNENFTYYTGEERIVQSYKIGILGLLKLKRIGVPFTTNPEKANKWASKKFINDAAPLMIKKKAIFAEKIRLSDIADEYPETENEKTSKENKFREELLVTNSDNIEPNPTLSENVNLTRDTEQTR